MNSVIKKCGWIFFSILSLGALGVVAVGGLIYIVSAKLPDHRSLQKYTPSLASRVFLKDGSKLCEYAYERRYFIPIDKIPSKLINSFIVVEDKNFYTHCGIDLQGILRSLVNNISNIGSGKRPQGASTITQQIARIFLIKNNEVSYIRKLKEALLSLRIESVLSKKQILELYLNQIYLGLGCYGVAAAAKVYFNKTVNELTVAECAYLAALAKGANNYHPVKNKEKALIRRNWAIDRLHVNGFISDSEASEAKAEDLTLSEQDKNIHAEYFSEEIRKSLIDKYPFDSLNKEGIIVRATLDAQLQEYAYKALKKGLQIVDRRFAYRGGIDNIDIKRSKEELVQYLKDVKTPKGGEDFQKAVVVSILTRHGHRDAVMLVEDGSYKKISAKDLAFMDNRLHLGDVIFVEVVKKNEKVEYEVRQIPEVQGALVVLDVHTGKVLAMQGGYSFLQSEFNRATQAKRQCGSAFKPFVYLSALEDGFAPNTIINAGEVEIDLGEAIGIWKPKNYGNSIIDKITLRQAIERSVNTATVRLAQEVGMHKIAEIAKKFGVFEKMPELYAYALGAGEVTLLDLTTAYAMFANGGKKIEPVFIDYIQDKYGNILYTSDTRSVEESEDEDLPPKLNDYRAQIINEQSLYQLTSLLEGVVKRGSGYMANSLNYPVAGKTGTSNNSRDAWFIGYTPDIAVGVFVGFDDHARSLGEKAVGGNIALPIFVDFMKKAKNLFPAKPFHMPKGIRLRKVDLITGGAPVIGAKQTIILEAFKEDDDTREVMSSIITPVNSVVSKDGQENNENDVKTIIGIY